MLRDGPIPRFLHGLLEYAAAVLLLAAPFLLDFESGAATAASIVAGVLLLFLAATSEGPTSLVDQVPVAVHVLVDYALVAVLIAAPFLFGFSGESEPTAFFIGLGALFLLVSIGTRYKPREQGDAGGTQPAEEIEPPEWVAEGRGGGPDEPPGDGPDEPRPGADAPARPEG